MNKIKAMFKNRISFGIKIIPFLIVSIVVGVTVAYAGSLTPPETVTNTMYSITDIYNLGVGNTSDEGSGDIEATPGTIAETGVTLTDAYNVIATEIAKLSSGVIASGTTAFGIEGSQSVVDTSDSDATAEDLATDKTAYVNGEKITGTATIEAIFDTTNKTISCNLFNNNGTLCQEHGCWWVQMGEATSCTGAGANIMTHQEAVSACASSTVGGYPAGTWRLPKEKDFPSEFIDNNYNFPVSFTAGLYWIEDQGYWGSYIYDLNDLSSLCLAGTCLENPNVGYNLTRCVR